MIEKEEEGVAIKLSFSIDEVYWWLLSMKMECPQKLLSFAKKTKHSVRISFLYLQIEQIS